MSGMRAKNEKKFSISRRETQASLLLPSFPTTIWEILAIFSRRTISCKGLFLSRIGANKYTLINIFNFWVQFISHNNFNRHIFRL